LLEGLNRGLPRLGISKTSKVNRAIAESNRGNPRISGDFWDLKEILDIALQSMITCFKHFYGFLFSVHCILTLGLLTNNCDSVLSKKIYL
jgi:hypothetical protein